LLRPLGDVHGHIASIDVETHVLLLFELKFQLERCCLLGELARIYTCSRLDLEQY